MRLKLALATLLISSSLSFSPFTLVLASELAESKDKGFLYVAYPKDGSKISSASTFVVGAGAADKPISVNGTAVRKNAQGFFAQVIPLKKGTNTLNFAVGNEAAADKTVNVTRPIPQAPLAATSFEIRSETIEPREDLGVSVGDLVILKVRATPGGEVVVKLDNREVTLSSAVEVRKTKQSKKSKPTKKGGKKTPAKTVAPNVNDGLATAYGKVFQSLPAGADDLYVGFYKVQPDDRFSSRKLKFTLKKDGKTVSATSSHAVTVLTQPHMVQTIHDDTVVRVSPDKARLTPLPAGVRMMIDGWTGDNLRCLYGPGQHVYIKSEDTAYEKGSGPPAKSFVSTINIGRSNYGDSVVIPLNQRLPFHIEQSLNPNKLLVKIYGATSDTDFASQQYKAAFEDDKASDDTPTSGSITRNAAEPGMVDGISWRQVSDDVYEATVRVRGNRQWGYAATYQGSNLVLHVKNPPAICYTKVPNQPLSGLNICIDPGHGGAQPGSTGCSGVTEAQLNLAISMRLKRLLESEGARVIMTRTTDVDLGLYERCDMAKNQGADVLLSVHNNALPDGRDPWKEHGSSTYWYQPQSSELARVIKDALVADVGFPDIGSRYQNLALVRPSNMLAVLAEIGFMIHPDEYAQLIKPEVQDRIAQALSQGLKKYFGKLAQ